MTIRPLVDGEVVEAVVEQVIDPAAVVLTEVDRQLKSIVEWEFGEIFDRPHDRPCRFS